MLQKIKKFFKNLGPGLVTGASDDDPSGITTYSQAGASFGFGTLWTTLLTFPLMAAIQEMSGRIGLVTKKGLAKVIKENYSPWLIYLVGLVTLPALVLNIAADLAGMGAVINMIFPAINSLVATISVGTIIIVTIVFLPYPKIAYIMKWLCILLLVYLVVPFFVKINWSQVGLASITPHFAWDKNYISIIVAILGTTISPYLFFWESNMEVEEREAHHSRLGSKLITTMQTDNFVGMLFSQVIMFFIILTAGATLFANGINNINSVQDAAQALKPIAGNSAYLLFALGVIGTGFLAIPVLSGVSGYMLAEVFGWREGMNRKFSESKAFYIVIVLAILLGITLNLTGLDPIKALVGSAIVYGVTAPILILIILFIANNRKIMGHYTNKFWSNTFGIIGFLVNLIAAIALIYTSL